MFGNNPEMFGNNPNDSERNPNDFRMKSELFPNRPLQINEHLMAIQPTNDDLSQFNAKFAIKGGRSGKVWRFVFNGVPYGSLLKFTVADPYGSPTPFWHISDTFLTPFWHFTDTSFRFNQTKHASNVTKRPHTAISRHYSPTSLTYGGNLETDRFPLFAKSGKFISNLPTDGTKQNVYGTKTERRRNENGIKKELPFSPSHFARSISYNDLTRNDIFTATYSPRSDPYGLAITVQGQSQRP